MNSKTAKKGLNEKAQRGKVKARARKTRGIIITSILHRPWLTHSQPTPHTTECPKNQEAHPPPLHFPPHHQ